MANARCPRCDAEAVYVGLNSLECPTADCPNYRPRDGEPVMVDQLSFEIDLLAYGLWSPTTDSAV